MTMIISIGPRLETWTNSGSLDNVQTKSGRVTSREDRLVSSQTADTSRSRIGRGRLLVGGHRLVDVFFDARDAFLELGDALAQRPHDAGKAIAEDQQGNERDDHQLGQPPGIARMQTASWTDSSRSRVISLVVEKRQTRQPDCTRRPVMN